MAIRTFYWEAPTLHPALLFIKRNVFNRGWSEFRYGNAGDILGRDLLHHFYPDEAISLCGSDEPSKLLTVGSIAHCGSSGDVLIGTGCKSPDLPQVTGQAPYAHSVRGPLSLEACRKAGYDVSQIAYLADPGLMISAMVAPAKSRANRVIFIPHYRERSLVRSRIPSGISMVDIDCRPAELARTIMEAELVYTSSLHGVIFSHALGRPCVLVRPQTEESWFKYEDYFLSMNLEMPVPLEGIEEAASRRSPVSPVSLPIQAQDITAPPRAKLVERGIIV